MDWRAAVSFSERLAKIVKITHNYKLAYPNVPPVDVSKEAQALEGGAYADAGSFADYEHRCDSIIEELWPEIASSGNANAQQAAEDEDKDLLAGPHADIGKYKGAVHFRNGLFSEVYKARKPDVGTGSKAQNGSLVALKLTTPAMMSAPHDSEREARILSKAKSEEKNIVPLLETFSLSGGRFVLVFEYMPWDLDHLLQKQISSRTQIQSIIKDLFIALAHIHSLGILHRDIKPSNILLKSPSGPAFLTDFGIAWQDGDKASEPADQKITDVGTTHYRAPELLFGNHRYGPSLDMWAAGCVVAEAACLNGQPLFDSGELGSDLALIQSHFKILGTPDLEVWPGARDCDDWGKMEFYRYAPKPWEDVLPSCDGRARDLVSKLVAYESSTRLTAAEALRHEYFQS
ncbi:putative cell division protein kinase [Phyllosticta citrichinensis]|uniref:cyclin-dependent kinase n=1 Tax=Phyllosticta citrichinensis TaxID=1130410 RepID=A0ABR1XHF3_9PEZI